MSKSLAKILDKPEEEVAKAIHKLESICGFPSEDARLLAEARQKLNNKISQLGLDPQDTTDAELYHALQARFDSDGQSLDRALGIEPYTPVSERVSKTLQLIEHLISKNEHWAVKTSVLRKVLTASPPKQLAKKLHYRSIASMMKREDIYEIYLAASVIESPAWHKSLTSKLAKLSSDSYELRSIKIMTLNSQRWNGIYSPASYVISDARLAIVALWPSDKLKDISSLSLALLLLDGIEKIEPADSLKYLTDLHPALHWWADCAYVSAQSGRTVSLNLKDVAINKLNNHGLDQSVFQHAAAAFWSELTGRYHAISDAVAQAIPDTSVSFDNPETKKLPAGLELTPEFVEIE